MKYEKAMVSIINLGNEDILTCSGQIGCVPQQQNYMSFFAMLNPMNWFKQYQPQQQHKPTYTGYHNGWGGGWGRPW